jgi:hypothetical protein
MKGERHLKLVPPPPDGPQGDADRRAAKGSEAGLGFDAGPDEPPPTEAELREALELERALDQGIDPLAAALRSAYRPEPLEDVDHDALLARALGDEGAPPTTAERREAERLAGELDAMKGRRAAPEPVSEPAELAAALKAAWAPRSIEPLRNEALIAKALQKEKAPSRGRRALPVTMAALTTLAAVAAGVALFFSRAGLESTSPTASAPVVAGPSVAQAALIRARSTTDLFDPETPFPRSGGTSERMDRIVSARSADLRANRFASWGVP